MLKNIIDPLNMTFSSSNIYIKITDLYQFINKLVMLSYNFNPMFKATLYIFQQLMMQLNHFYAIQILCIFKYYCKNKNSAINIAATFWYILV